MPAKTWLDKATEYTVVYRTGGTANCKWNRTVTGTRAECEKMRTDTEKMGYKALLFKTVQLDSIGMPEGWDYSPVTG